ncbi:hypothetical protein [Flexithrix dorotheae]|uniref:hypothetical protein n=1 Tax=Flexithrix dorotheae TaxID=70993 RepID=UPI00037B7B29|nr:hypothetical protein [Flexithrix dorotheae]
MKIINGKNAFKISVGKDIRYRISFACPWRERMADIFILSRKTFLKVEIFGRSAAAVLFIEWKSIEGFINLQGLSFRTRLF